VNGGERRRRPDGVDHGRWPRWTDASHATSLLSLGDGPRAAEDNPVDDVPLEVGITTPASGGGESASQHRAGPLSRAVYLEVGNNAGVVVGGSATRGRTNGLPEVGL
jgi:hypothetical protein